MENSSRKYYKNVASHFDQDAQLFEQRYDENPILHRIRKEFRFYTELHYFDSALEIGCGPGIDVEYFASKYPDKKFVAIDVSPQMVRLVNQKVAENDFKNVRAISSTVEELEQYLGAEKFDMVYVYFGGLNTVTDLRKNALIIKKFLKPNGTLVLTCVNRYYVVDAIIRMLKLKFRSATARFRNKWPGYSPGRDLKSNVYSYKYIKKCFDPDFEIVQKRGYSLFYPPWYGARHLKNLGSIAEVLWKIDSILQKTPFWNTGEYSLYVMKVR